MGKLKDNSLGISIGICAYNEEGNIGRLLNNILKQSVTSKYDLMEIVVVSSSTDKTDDIVNKMMKEDSRIKLIKEKRRGGKAQALNIFLKNALGDILVIISADAIPCYDSIEKLVEAFKPSVGGACVRTLPYNYSNVIEFGYRFLWNLHNRFLYDESIKGTLNHLGGDMWAIRKGIVYKLPTNIINDDAYIGIILRKKKWKIAYVNEAYVSIKGPSNPIDYIKQRVRIIIGHKNVMRVTGTKPGTIGSMGIYNPFKIFNVFIKEISSYKMRDIPKIIVVLFLEVIAQILANIKFYNKEKYIIWEPIKSTKA